MSITAWNLGSDLSSGTHFSLLYPWMEWYMQRLLRGLLRLNSSRSLSPAFLIACSLFQLLTLWLSWIIHKFTRTRILFIWSMLSEVSSPFNIKVDGWFSSQWNACAIPSTLFARLQPYRARIFLDQSICQMSWCSWVRRLRSERRWWLYLSSFAWGFIFCNISCSAGVVSSLQICIIADTFTIMDVWDYKYVNVGIIMNILETIWHMNNN